MAQPPARRKEIYGFEAKDAVFSLAWANHPEHAHRLALGSFVEDYTNTVTIVDLVEPDFRLVSSFEHPYPPTKIAFAPEKVRRPRSTWALPSTHALASRAQICWPRRVTICVCGNSTTTTRRCCAAR